MSAGYGTDTYCADSLRTGRLDRGPGLVVRALFRRLITPAGALQGVRHGGEEEAIYGFDVAGYIGAVGLDDAERALSSLVRAQCLQDDRVSTLDQVDVTRRLSSDGMVALEIQVVGTLADSDTDFSLTMSATAAGVELISNG